MIDKPCELDLEYATMCLGLALAIHGNDPDKVSAVAWRVITQLPYRLRGAVALIIQSSDPVKVVKGALWEV